MGEVKGEDWGERGCLPTHFIGGVGWKLVPDGSVYLLIVVF